MFAVIDGIVKKIDSKIITPEGIVKYKSIKLLKTYDSEYNALYAAKFELQRKMNIINKRLSKFN